MPAPWARNPEEGAGRCRYGHGCWCAQPAAGQIGPDRPSGAGARRGSVVAKYGHGQVRNLGAAHRAAVGLLLVHWLNLATTNSAFHGRRAILFSSVLPMI